MFHLTRASIGVTAVVISLGASLFTATAASATPTKPASPSPSAAASLPAVSTTTPLMTDGPQWTKEFQVPAAPADGAAVPDSWSNEYCVGNFAQASLEVDGAGAVYLHFGGIQQCAPSPEDQSLEIDLWNEQTGEFVREAYSGYHVANTVTAYSEPTCDSAAPTTYYMKAYGYVEGYGNMTPYPAISGEFSFNCFIAA